MAALGLYQKLVKTMPGSMSQHWIRKSHLFISQWSREKISPLSPLITILAVEWQWLTCSTRDIARSGIFQVRWIGGKHVSAWRPGKMLCRNQEVKSGIVIM